MPFRGWVSSGGADRRLAALPRPSGPMVVTWPPPSLPALPNRRTAHRRAFLSRARQVRLSGTPSGTTSSNGSTPCQSPGSCGGFSPASSFGGGGSSPSPIPFASASAPSAAQFQMQAQLQQRGLSKKRAVAKPGGRHTHPWRPLTDAHVCAHAGCKRRCMAPPSRARWRCREGLTLSGTLTARYHPASCPTRPTRGAHTTSRRCSRRCPVASRPTCRRPLSTYGTPALVEIDTPWPMRLAGRLLAPHQRPFPPPHPLTPSIPRARYAGRRRRRRGTASDAAAAAGGWAKGDKGTRGFGRTGLVSSGAAGRNWGAPCRHI